MEKSIPLETDILVVGLGICGLSSAYHLAKSGRKVVGLQQYADSGMVGTSSAGYTRSYREDANIPEFRECASYNKQIWNQLEEEFSLPILKDIENIRLGQPSHPSIKNMLDRMKELKGFHILTKQQLEQKYPLFKVRKGDVGIWSFDAAVTNVKNALRAFKLASLKQGASFHYSTEVTKIDTLKQKVDYIKNGAHGTIQYKTLVMSCGPYTERFRVRKNVEVIETETYTIKSLSGVPLQGAYHGEQNFYFLPNDFDITELKIGLHESKSLRKIHKIMKEQYPTLFSSLGQASPCFFTRVTPTTGLNIYKEGNTVWAYGYDGYGFKHGPSMGRKVLRLIESASPKL